MTKVALALLGFAAFCMLAVLTEITLLIWVFQGSSPYHQPIFNTVGLTILVMIISGVLGGWIRSGSR